MAPAICDTTRLMSRWSPHVAGACFALLSVGVVACYEPYCQSFVDCYVLTDSDSLATCERLLDAERARASQRDCRSEFFDRLDCWEERSSCVEAPGFVEFRPEGDDCAGEQARYGACMGTD